VEKPENLIEVCWIISWSGDQGKTICERYLYADFLKDEENRFFCLRVFLIRKGSLFSIFLPLFRVEKPENLPGKTLNYSPV